MYSKCKEKTNWWHERQKKCTCCGTGYRGNIAADELNKEGFYAVTLDGGYSAWM